LEGRTNRGVSSLLRLEIVVGGFAILLLGGALAADQAWFDRHFPAIFAIRHSVMIAAERGLRGFVILAATILLLICRRPIARLLSRASPAGCEGFWRARWRWGRLN
jgi:hypothetical protein